MNGAKLCGGKITVEEARPREGETGLVKRPPLV